MYYIKGSNKIYGPISAEKVRELLAGKRINLNVQVSTDQKTWRPLNTFPEFASSNATQNPSSGMPTPVTTATPVTVGNNTRSVNPTSVNSSGSMSFDFLQNANSSALPSENANNPFAQQQFSMAPTPVQSVPVQQAAQSSIPVPEEQWFLSNDGVNGYGPYPTSQVVAMIQNRQIQANSLAWRNGENAVQISIIPSFANYFNRGSANYANSNKRHGRKKVHHGPVHSRTTYILLGFFFGCLGFHNFYAGYVGRGLIQLLSILCLIGIFFVPLWVLIEICTVTRDARGVPFE